MCDENCSKCNEKCCLTCFYRSDWTGDCTNRQSSMVWQYVGAGNCCPHWEPYWEPEEETDHA